MMRCLASAVLVLVAPVCAAAEPEDADRDPGVPTEDEPPRWTEPTLHGLGLMSAMRVGEAVIWPEPFAFTNTERWAENYRRAFSNWPRWDSSRRAFEWDGDPWYVNGVGHAIFGSELYLRARTCHHGILPAALFTAAGTVIWEYGFEANGVQPSGLDLWYTPAVGLVLGEARFVAWSAARRIDQRVWRSVLTVVLDPFGELERALGTRC